MTLPRSVVGVLLAAGTASRFGDGQKLLAELDGEPLVHHAARTLLDANVDGIVAVLGDRRERVAAALPEGVETVHNPDYAEGQATTVARGVRAAADRGADAAVIALGDMPCVDAGTVAALVDAFRGTGSDIVVPTAEGRRGNPVLFGAAHFDTLQSVSGDRGGRALFDSYPVERVAVADPGIHLDVDTEDDMQALAERCPE
ncbi:nucleotidyltransferase family protein [Haloarchaeobius iranensis]|uniref:Molybdenum cofactor cytidylyltransferase n=1 Tax=Haloarchaeobius iranensis TaxID=996166 RepID=A0A1G9UYM4_9EURY|nr:nucleotidyltransferase family protein [Haloarchaeobius iranensis]SDM65101.1 molybdenum cofactor cytidylyltransferase [Haloarchaeobius iranensis]